MAEFKSERIRVKFLHAAHGVKGRSGKVGSLIKSVNPQTGEVFTSWSNDPAYRPERTEYDLVSELDRTDPKIIRWQIEGDKVVIERNEEDKEFARLSARMKFVQLYGNDALKGLI